MRERFSAPSSWKIQAEARSLDVRLLLITGLLIPSPEDWNELVVGNIQEKTLHDDVYNAHKSRFDAMNCFVKYKSYTNTNAMPAFCRNLAIQS